MDPFILIAVVFWSYVALLACAALFDVCKFTIPNWISLALVGLFLVAAFTLPVRFDWLSHLGAMAVVLCGSLLLYRFGFIGGGDLKLMAAVGLWVGLGDLLQLVVWVGIAGAVFTLSVIALRRLLTGALVAQTAFQQVTLPRVLLPGEQIPYGVAIAAGGIWLARGLPHLGLFV